MRRQKSTLLQADVPLQTPPAPPNGSLPADVVEKLRRLEVISQLVEICNSTTNLNELMEKVFKTVMKDVGAEAGSLWLSEEGSEENVCYVAEGTTRDKVLNLKLEKGVGVVGFVIDSGECQTVFDTSQDERFSSSVDKKTGFQTRSMICAPLIVENKAIGAIQLLNKKSGSGKFNNEDLALLKLLCQGSATPIVNARLRASEKKVQELSIMLDISKEITSTLDLDGCMLSVVNLCSKLISYDRAAISLVDKDDLKIAAISGRPSINQNDPDTLMLKNLLSGVNKSGEDIYIPSGKKYLKATDSASHVQEYLNRYHQGSLAIYRLFDEESELGVFMMESKKENLISGSQIERIGILKNMLTVALRNAQLYNSVPKLSVWDSWKKAKEVPLKKYLIVGSVVAAIITALAVIRPAYKVTGKIEVRPDQKYVLYARVGGQVEKVMDPGKTTVLAGDTLIKFKTEEVEQDLEKKRNQLHILAQSMASLRQQSKHSELHLKSLEYREAEVGVASLERQLKESVILSPVDGVLLNDQIQELVDRRFSQGDEITEVIASGKKALHFMVPEQEIHQIKKGQKVTFRVPAFPGESFEGTVRQITYETVAEENSTYFPVVVDVDQGMSQLLPGMTGRGKLKIGQRSLLMSIVIKVRDYLAIKYWL